MDVKDDVYYDAKEPHVSFERNCNVIVNHVLLSEIDNLVGTGDSDLKRAIDYVRKHKDELREIYMNKNR